MTDENGVGGPTPFDHLAEAAALGIDPLIPWRLALHMMGMSPATGRRRSENDPTFPERVAIGPNRWALRASTIRQWNDSRPTDREIAFKRPPAKKALPEPVAATGQQWQRHPRKRPPIAKPRRARPSLAPTEAV